MFYPNMYSPHRKLESRSVHTPNLDDPVRTDQPLFERRPISMAPRPYSAKEENQGIHPINARSNRRPVSASKQVPASMVSLLRKGRKASPKKERDVQVLAKLRPNKIALEKERLYDDAMHLKLDNNELRSENVRLKTKLNQLDRELTRTVEILEDVQAERATVTSPHLISGLKQSIKDLRQALKAKDIEIALLKRNAKSTKMTEMEVEIRTYSEECKRLQSTLNEVCRGVKLDGKEEVWKGTQRDESEVWKREKAMLISELKKSQIDNKKQAELIEALERKLGNGQDEYGQVEELQLKFAQQQEHQRTELEAQKVVIDSLRVKNQELEISNTARNELESKLQARNRENDVLTQELEQVRNKIEEQEADFFTKLSTVKELESELKTAQDQLHSVKEALDQSQLETDQVQSQVTDLAQVITSKESELALLHTECQSLHQDLKTAQTQVEKTLKENHMLVSTLRQKEGEAVTALEQLHNTEANLEKSHEEVTELKAQLSLYIKQLGDKETQTTTLLAEQQTHEIAPINAHPDTHELEENKAQIRSLEEELNRLERVVSDKDRDIGVLHADLSQSLDEIKELKTNLQTALLEIDVLKNDFTALKARVSEVLSPIFTRIGNRIDSMHGKEAEFVSLEALRKDLETAEIMVDETVLKVMNVFLSDDLGKISLKKLRLEISASKSIFLDENPPQIDPSPRIEEACDEQIAPPEDSVEAVQSPKATDEESPPHDTQDLVEPKTESEHKKTESEGDDPYRVEDFEQASSSSDHEALSVLPESQHPSFNPISHPRLPDLIRHISFRLQLNRIAKKNLINLLFESEASVPVSVVKEHFCLQPLLITEKEDQEILVSAMLGTQLMEGQELNAEEATRRLSALMEDWRIFTQDDEEVFDRQTALALTTHATEFVSLCEENDSRNSGQIPYRAFEDILRMLEIDFSSSHLRYLQLLFYSENYELDAVPYLNLMSAYVAQEEQEEQGEEELSDSQAEKLRGQLHLIATQLDAQGKKVRDAFETDTKGVISPNAFLQGIANLRLADPDEETLDLLYQSLLSDEQEGVPVSELEALLKELMLKKGSEGEVLRSKKSSTSELNE